MLVPIWRPDLLLGQTQVKLKCLNYIVKSGCHLFCEQLNGVILVFNKHKGCLKLRSKRQRGEDRQ